MTPPPARSPFDPPLEDMREMGHQVLDLVTRFVDGRYDAPSADYTRLEPMLRALAAPPPADGEPLAGLLETITAAAGKGFDTANPGFAAYVPGGGLYASALADLIACCLNRYTGIAEPAPALVQMEASVLRWLCDVFGLPPTSQGVLTPGGSMANLSAIVTARSTRLGDRLDGATLYVSEETHHSVLKSARFAGLPDDAVRLVRTDHELRMDADALRAAVREDRRRDRRPFLVVASAGTINTGVVDPLGAVADVAAQEDLWLHVDGAYGACFQLTDRGRSALHGIDRADSITLDPHKGLFLPYGTGCLLARDGGALRQAHEVHAGYLPPPSDDGGPPDFSSFSPELTRDFRGLRLWLPLHLHGVRAFSDALDDKLDLARMVHERLSDVPRLELPWVPVLSLVAFRPRNGTEQETHDLLGRVNASGRVWLSSAPVRGTTYVRMCILSHRSTRERMEEAVDLIAAAADR
jgi:aromatic-L-amino-acid/L-tryptophan decarboxylase